MTGEPQERFTPSVQRDHPLRRHHSRGEILHIEGLGEIIVGARLAPGEVVLLVAQRRDHDEVGVWRVGLADATAEIGTLDPRHEPIAEDDVRAVLHEQAPRLLAVAGKRHRLTLTLDQIVQQVANAGVVLGDEHAHAFTEDYSLTRAVATSSAHWRKSAMRYGLAMTRSTPRARASVGSIAAPQPVTSTKRVLGQRSRTKSARSQPFLPAPRPRSEITSSNA